jgi:hypothetical protein
MQGLLAPQFDDEKTKPRQGGVLFFGVCLQMVHDQTSHNALELGA